MKTRLVDKIRTSNQFIFNSNTEVLHFLETYFPNTFVRNQSSIVKSTFDWYTKISQSLGINQIIGVADVTDKGRIQFPGRMDYDTALIKEPINFIVVGNMNCVKQDTANVF